MDKRFDSTDDPEKREFIASGTYYRQPWLDEWYPDARFEPAKAYPLWAPFAASPAPRRRA